MPDSTVYNPHSTPRDDVEFVQERSRSNNLLKAKKGAIPKLMQKKWDAQDPHFERRFAVWKVNVLRHMGYRNVALQFDEGHWDYYLPPNASPDNLPMLSKLAEVIRKLTAIMFADPPASQVEPFSWSDDEVFAAQIATRVLEDVDSESMLSDIHKARHAFTKASDYGSGFIYYYAIPNGGQKAPLQIEAHPAATHVDNALTHPETGAQLPPPYVKRYVMPDGRLSERPQDAAMRDLPILGSRVLTGRNVRFLPHNSADIWDADGVMIGEFLTWGRVRNLFPKELGNLPEDQVDKILQYRPKRADDIRSWDQNLDLGSNDRNKDERLVWVLTIYYRKTTDYPNGAHLVAIGNQKLVLRGTWDHQQEDGTTSVLDIPLTQYGQWREGRDDPYFVGTSELLGSADEFRAAQFAAIIDHLDRINHQKIFVDVHSIMDPQDLFRRDKRVIRTSGDKPTYENVPPISRDVLAIFADISEQMPNAVGLGETTTGLESPSVKSGRHALAVVQQAQATLSELTQNISRAHTRAGRIKLQLIRKFFKQPRMAGWTTEDDEFRLDSWSRVDLGNARDVKIKPGTMTLLTPVAKAQLAEHYFALGILDQFKMYDIFSGNLGGTLGLEDDPVRLRIRRQIAEWKNGPPEGWVPPEPQQQMDPMTGQVVQVVPADPVLEQIWQGTPADYMPAVAMVRINELIRLMSSKKYMSKPQPWKARVEQEFQTLIQAVQPTPQPGAEGAASPVQANAAGSPAQQPQANDLAGLTDTANAPGQRPSPGTE